MKISNVKNFDIIRTHGHGGFGIIRLAYDK